MIIECGKCIVCLSMSVDKTYQQINAVRRRDMPGIKRYKVNNFFISCFFPCVSFIYYHLYIIYIETIEEF